MTQTHNQTLNQTHNTLGRTLRPAALAAVALLGLAAPALHAAPSYGTQQVVLSPGTVIPVNLVTGLSSKTAQAGDGFSARVDDSKQAYNSLMAGATITGVVRRAAPRDGDTAGTLDLAFTRLRLADGRILAITGSPASLNAKDLTTRTDGVLVAKSTKKDNRLTYAGYGAGAGLLVGLLTGHKSVNLQDILLGGLAGYGAGSLLKSKQEVHDVDLEPGTALGVRLDSRTRYYHKAAKPAVKRNR